MNIGRPSSVKREVLPVAVEIAKKGTVYNWSSYLVDLLIENIKNCQDTGASIRFPSLIIWLAMTDITPVGEAQFTATDQPFMFNFRDFSMHNKQVSGHPKQLFELWFQNLKVKCGKWRVPQYVRRSLPDSVQVDLQLDHTRVWSSVENAQEAVDLDYSPSVVAIYADLSRQVGQAMQPPTVAFLRTERISKPLTEAEKE